MMSAKISTDWVKGLEGEEKEEHIKMLRSSLALKQLKEILLQWETAQEKQEVTQGDYDNPSWAYKQADRNGYKRLMTRMKELLSFIE